MGDYIELHCPFVSGFVVSEVLDCEGRILRRKRDSGRFRFLMSGTHNVGTK